MPENLNLLPPELAVSKSLASILKTMRALSVIAVVLFIVSSVGLGVFFVISNLSLNSLNQNIALLKTQVSAQESSEQQIVALKDRVAKIEQAKASPSALKTTTDIDSALTGLSPTSEITQFDADATKADISMNFSTNSDLTSFLQNFSASSNTFSSVVLSSFGYTPAAGYLVGLTIVEK